MDRIILAHSDGLDAATAIRALRQRLHAEVVTVAFDYGQRADLVGLRDEALAAGAARAHVLDVRKEFARDFIVPSLKAGARLDRGGSTLSVLSRPLMAKELVAIARLERAGTIAHGWSRGQKDHLRMVRLMEALEPALQVVPRDWAAGRLSESLSRFAWSRPGTEPARSVEEAAYVDITLNRGVPTAVNDVDMELEELLDVLATIAGAHTVAACAVLQAAHSALVSQVSSHDLERFCRHAGARYEDLVEAGQWFAPMRRALDAFAGSVNEQVSGRVTLKLFQSACTVIRCSSASAASAIGQDQSTATDNPGSDGELADRPVIRAFQVAQ